MKPVYARESSSLEDAPRPIRTIGHYERFTRPSCRYTTGLPGRHLRNHPHQRAPRRLLSGKPSESFPTSPTNQANHQKSFRTVDVESSIGGTVGDIESLPFLESIRQMLLELGRGTLSSSTSLCSLHRRRRELKPSRTAQRKRNASSSVYPPAYIAVPSAIATSPRPEKESRPLLQRSRNLRHIMETWRHHIRRASLRVMLEFQEAQNLAFEASRRVRLATAIWCPRLHGYAQVSRAPLRCRRRAIFFSGRMDVAIAAASKMSAGYRCRHFFTLCLWAGLSVRGCGDEGNPVTWTKIVFSSLAEFEAL